MSRDVPLQPADLAEQPPARDDLAVTTAATLNDGRLVMHPDCSEGCPESDEWLLADRDDWVALEEVQ